MTYVAESKIQTFGLNIFAKLKPYSKILQHASEGPRHSRLVKRKTVEGKNHVTLSL